MGQVTQLLSWWAKSDSFGPGYTKAENAAWGEESQRRPEHPEFLEKEGVVGP